jgi:ubiquinone/menaquinone biosynthesis C-methylase UbiE
VDYDSTDIPAAYDRGRSLTTDMLDLWMDTVAGFTDIPVRTILDLGCGTGRFSDALAVRFAARVIAIDPSEKMLAEARGKRMRGDVRLVRARAEALPIGNNAVDFIFTSMTYHHFSDAARVAEECRRIGQPRAVTFVRTGMRDRTEEYAYVPFIPETRPLINETLPSRAEIVRTFESAGLITLATAVVVQQLAPTYQAYADKLAAGGDSILASVPSSVLVSGLEAIRRYGRRVDPIPVTEPIDVLVFRARIP